MIYRQAMVYKPAAPKPLLMENDESKPNTSKSIVPGGSGFAVTKDLVQSLKKSTTKETNDTSNVDDEKPTSSNNLKEEMSIKAEKPKYDWGSAPGRSMCSSNVHMETEETENVENEAEPEYHIVSTRRIKK